MKSSIVMTAADWETVLYIVEVRALVALDQIPTTTANISRTTRRIDRRSGLRAISALEIAGLMEPGACE